MQPSENQILDSLAALGPISLKQMKGIRLMNRIDTKFVCRLDLIPRLLALAAERGYMAQEVSSTEGLPVRLCAYRSLYYDTPGCDMYHIHHNRRMVRQKIRSREYVDTGDSFIEIKNKDNHGRTHKLRTEMPIEAYGSATECAQVLDYLKERSMFPAESLSPALETAFRRITLVNKGLTERVTLDLSLSFGNARNGRSVTAPHLVILELKRDGRQRSGMLEILRELRITPYKISKYCVGMAMTDPALKQNRFKMKIRRIAALSELTNDQ